MFNKYFGFLLSISLISFSNSVNAGKIALQGTLFSGSFYVKPTNSSKYIHNDTKEAKVVPELKDGESMAGTEAAVLIIVVICVLSVIGMVVYFVRKFDQLNRSLPTYRYSSLKTEINGMYGADDKIESQILVNVSTEEEDDFDDDEEDNLSPPTLLVKSQTVMSSKSSNGSVPVHCDSSFSSQIPTRNEETSVDSDEELLQ